MNEDLIMSYVLIGDSCCDFTKLEIRKPNTVRIPMLIIIGGVEYKDDGTRTQKDWIDMIKADPDYPRSACPSPDAFFNAFQEDEDNYVVTLSSKLSGVYNSAQVAKEMFLDEHPDAKIHVFDSKSAAAGQHLIYEEIFKRADAGMEFEKVVEEVEKFRDEMTTIFVLDDLETFKKNGRLKGIKAVVATAMNIKPVLIGDDGDIKQIDQGIGLHKTVNLMLKNIEKMDPDRSRTVRITQCDSSDMCLKVAKILKEKFGFNDIKILNAGGLSTIYENPGGIIIAF